MLLEFSGAATSSLLSTTAHSGRYYWWGNRGDLMNSRLVIPLDLRDVEKATLRFWVWYDVETSYDYVYLTASADGGRSWSNLGGRFTTDANPTGNNLGRGWTGVSGGGPAPVWVQEEVDLSPFAGKQVLLGYDYVTDDGYVGQGFALDDIQVPEVGFFDDGEKAGTWQAEGFVRTDGEVPQRYVLHLVQEGTRRSVERVEVDANQRSHLLVPAASGDSQRLTLIVAALAPLTGERAPIRLSLRTLSPAQPVRGAY